mmetsp:Transcript_24798/g.48512  ORF Transcript_24798/g.48512 Transcript_24798/m.48512 type:complete len:153 (+) Transcript_24798:362-820(+)
MGVPEQGQLVVDLGSGSGTDALIAASYVGEKGKVIGIDMTPEMRSRAEENAKALKLSDRVSFVDGEIDGEDFPAALSSVQDSADLVISNGVFNLTANKARAFQVAFDVLRPGGRFQLADMVTYQKPSTPDAIEKKDILPPLGEAASGDLWAS